MLKPKHFIWTHGTFWAFQNKCLHPALKTEGVFSIPFIHIGQKVKWIEHDSINVMLVDKQKSCHKCTRTTTHITNTYMHSISSWNGFIHVHVTHVRLHCMWKCNNLSCSIQILLILSNPEKTSNTILNNNHCICISQYLINNFYFIKMRKLQFTC